MFEYHEQHGEHQITLGLTENDGHEIDGHENAGHEIGGQDIYIYRLKIDYITMQCAIFFQNNSRIQVITAK